MHCIKRIRKKDKRNKRNKKQPNRKERKVNITNFSILIFTLNISSVTIDKSRYCQICYKQNTINKHIRTIYKQEYKSTNIANFGYNKVGRSTVKIEKHLTTINIIKD